MSRALLIFVLVLSGCAHAKPASYTASPRTKIGDLNGFIDGRNNDIEGWTLLNYDPKMTVDNPGFIEFGTELRTEGNIDWEIDSPNTLIGFSTLLAGLPPSEMALTLECSDLSCRSYSRVRFFGRTHDDTEVCLDGRCESFAAFRAWITSRKGEEK